MKTYARCEFCDWEGESTIGIAFPSSSTVQVTMKNNAVACPECGHRAQLMEGSFQSDGRATTMISGPQWTIDMLKRITPAQAVKVKNATRWAMARLEEGADEGLVKQKVDAVLEKHAPAWKAALDAVLGDKTANLIQLLGFILLLLTFFGLDPASQQQSPVPVPGITGDQLRELFDEYFGEGTESDTPTPPPPAPIEPTPEQDPTQEA